MPKNRTDTLAHISQIQDMKEHYPEIATSLANIENHFKGLIRIKTKKLTSKAVS